MKIGILGGGQLATMLTEAAHQLGHTVVLVSQPDEPAVERANATIVGDFRDFATLEELFRRVDVVTIESELVDVALVRELEAKYPHVDFLPTADALAISQDKLAQKQLFLRCGLRTAEYRVLSDEVDGAELERVASELGGKVILKWARGGYDGRGVLPWGRGEDQTPALEFWLEGVRRGVRVFAEVHVPFTGEVAMVAVRHASGAFGSWPLMFTRQRQGTCREVYGPAVRMGVEPAVQGLALHAAQVIGSAGDFCGVFALEFFVTRDGLWINEMAPRVHNSGHFTLHGDEESQFMAHIRAVTRTPLVRPCLSQMAYMRNLLGPTNREFEAHVSPDITTPAGVAFFWYGKRRCKPSRKMGHLTGRCTTLEGLHELREQTCFWEQHFWGVLNSTGKDRGKWQE